MNSSWKNSWNRICAVILRIAYFERHNVVRLAEFFYWPLFDIVIWGMAGSWIEKSQSTSLKLVLLLMTGLVLWQVALRASYEISITLMEEMWGRSFINLFATPLNLGEWIMAVIFSGLLKMSLVLLYGGLLVALLYGLNIFAIGPVILLFSTLLMISGWAIGFATAAIIIRLGQRVGSLPWIMSYFFAPFSGVFYPVENLPAYVQYFSYSLPTTYVFDAMREYIQSNELLWDKIGMAVALNALYLSFTLGAFFIMFAKSKNRGLYRLE